MLERVTFKNLSEHVLGEHGTPFCLIRSEFFKALVPFVVSELAFLKGRSPQRPLELRLLSDHIEV